MEKQGNIKECKKKIDNALSNNFLRFAMDKFAIAYRTGKEKAFNGMNVNSLVKQVSSIKKCS